MKLIPWKLSHGTYSIEDAQWNLHHESYLFERTPLKLASGTYTMEVTSRNLHH